MLNIDQIKKEIEDDRLSSSEQKILEIKICRQYKGGSCQILSKKHNHNNVVSIHENEICWLKQPMTNIPSFPEGKGTPIKSFKGTRCEEKENEDCVCGFFPIT